MDEINTLRSLYDNVNRQTFSNAQQLLKLEQQQATTKVVADRALQLCDQLVKRVAALEADVKRLSQTSAQSQPPAPGSP